MKTKQIRIKLVDGMGNVSYVSVFKGIVTYFSAGETPLALSNMFDDAAATRFALQDAKDDREAIAIVRKHQKYAKTVELV